MKESNNLRVYITTTCLCTSDGLPVRGTERDVCVLYNQTQISYEDVKTLFETDMWEYDPRLVQMTTKQLEMLQDKEVM